MFFTKLKKFKTVMEILDCYCKCRLVLYKKRKSSVIKNLEHELLILNNKNNFLKKVIDGTLVIFRRPEEDIIKELEDTGFSKVSLGNKEKNYDYLLNLPNRNFTKNKLDQLQDNIDTKKQKLIEINSKEPQEIWIDELETLEEKYKPWLKKMTY